VVENKNSTDNATSQQPFDTKTALIQQKPIHCHDKAISHFNEVANKCREEGFGLIEDLPLQEAQFSDRSDIV